jgi:NhaP-type Na+/H+ or K+/H+ antiporter
VLAVIVASYGAASQARASGFLAVYVSAVVLGNARLPHGPATRGFAEGIGWLAQIGPFVMLGLLVSPARLPAQVLPAIAVGLVLVFLGRPAAVLAATLPLRLPWRQQAFLSWAGLRGAVPIVLATIPVSARVPGSARLFDLIFIVVGVVTLAQGPTLPWAARPQPAHHTGDRQSWLSPARPAKTDGASHARHNPERQPRPTPIRPAGHRLFDHKRIHSQRGDRDRRADRRISRRRTQATVHVR